MKSRLPSIVAVVFVASAFAARAAGAPPSDARVASPDDGERVAASDDGVLTLLDYFDLGRHRTDDFVARTSRASGHDVAGALARSRAACVRIEVQYNQQGDNYQAFTASGVLVGSGRRVLTAGHVLAGTKDATIRVTLTDGRSFSARPLQSRYDVFATGSEDWGLLEVIAPTDAALPSATLGTPAESELAFVMGYPAEIGVANGIVAPGMTHVDAPLDPLTFVSRVRRVAPLDLEPVAGCVPVGGASGAPVFNERGELLGVFVSVSQATSSGRVTQSYQAARLDGCATLVTPTRASLD